MSNICSSVQQSVGILGQLLLNQLGFFPPPTPFHYARDLLPNIYARNFLPSVLPNSTSTMIEPQPSSQEIHDVSEDQSQKTTVSSIKFYSCKEM